MLSMLNPHASKACVVRCRVYLLMADIVPNHVGIALFAVDSCSEVANLFNAD